MASSKIPSPPASTSDMKGDGPNNQPVVNEDRVDVQRSLEIISKVAALLKNEDNEFLTILEKVLAAIDGESDEKRKKKCELVQEIMTNILEADTEELMSAKGHFQSIFTRRKYKDSCISDDELSDYGLIGEGSFSYVLRASLLKNGSRKTVAVKKAKNLQCNRIIEQEVLVLSQLKHKNIVKFYGRHESEVAIVLQFMDLGNLLSAVEAVQFSTENLLRLLNDVACGMEYVHARHYLHRDLACRNVLVNKKKQCKISDFGMSVYVGESDGIYVEQVFEPCDFNLSPEAFATKTFTMANDVYAMGMLCWELFYIMEHAGELPPPAFTKKEHQALCQMTKKQLPKSRLCPDNLHRYIVNNLLNDDPKARPNFTAIRQKLEEIAANQAG